MNKLLQDYGGRIAALEIDGEKQLALRIAAGRKSFSLTKFSAVRNTSGYEIQCGEFHSGTVREWHLTGTCEIDGSVYFYGPFHRGDPLHTLLTTERHSNRDILLQGAQASGRALPIMRSLCSVFSALPDTIGPFFPNGVLLDLEAGNVLFLPPAVMELLTDEMDPEERDTVLHHYISSERSIPDNTVFLLAAAGYILTTGCRIEDSSPERDLHEVIRNTEILPPHYLNPQLRYTISVSLLESIYSPSAALLPRLTETFFSIETITNPDLPQEEIDRRTAELQEQTGVQNKRYKRSRFLRKHGWKVLLILIAGAAGGVLGGRMLYRASLPPITAGMSEQEVIRLFYKSYSELDNATMEKCVVKGVGKEEIETGMNLFVISRIRQAYEGTEVYIPAQQWVAEGKPPLKDNPLIFGITDVTVEKERGNTYIVRYREYFPGGMGEGQSGTESAAPVVADITERVTLTYRDEAWLISHIEEIQRTAVSTD